MTIKLTEYINYAFFFFFGEQERAFIKGKEEERRENVHNNFPYNLLFHCTESSHHRVP